MGFRKFCPKTVFLFLLRVTGSHQVPMPAADVAAFGQSRRIIMDDGRAVEVFLAGRLGSHAVGFGVPFTG